MNTFVKILGGVLVTVVLGLCLSKHSKDIGLLLAVAVCCMVLAAAVEFLVPVLEMVDTLAVVGQLEPEMLKILIKSVGIGLLTEIMSLICADAGYSTLGKTVQIIAAAVILWLCIPLLNSLMALLEEILSAV